MTVSELPADVQFALTAAHGKRIGRRKRRILFLIHSTETFSALEPVIEELRHRSELFELLFVALPRNYGSAGLHDYVGLEKTRAFLEEKGLDPIPLRGEDTGDLGTLIRLAPDFMFRQSPWDGDVPPAVHVQWMAFANLCYVPYVTMIVEEPDRLYDQDFHNACDLIFCESEFHLEEYRKHRRLGANGVHATGYPRLEAFAKALDADAGSWPVDVPDGVPRVIWAPHHSFGDWLTRSTFGYHAATMLEEAMRGRLSILFRPHPALRDKLVDFDLMTYGEFDEYVAAFDAAELCAVDTASEYIGTFAASDCMITDGVGFFAEYMLTGKPMFQTRRPDNKPLNSFGDWLVEACEPIDDTDALRRLLDELAEGRHEDAYAALREDRRTALREMSFGAAVRIADLLEQA